MKKNTNKNALLDKWFELRSEEIEANISKEDKKYMFSFQDLLDEILKIVPEDKKDLTTKLIDRYDDKYCECYIYWTRKYYMQGLKDCFYL